MKDILSEMKYFFTNNYRKIHNIIRWIPIMWKQYDFDSQYAIEVFKFQLQKTAKFLESDRAVTMCAKQRAMRIRTVIKLMDKVYDKEYGCEYQDKLKEMYGDDVLDFHFTPLEDKPGYSEMNWKFEKDETKSEELRNEIREVHDRLFKESHEKQKKAHRILWTLIEHNIQSWWD